MIPNLVAWSTGHPINDAVMAHVSRGIGVKPRHVREFTSFDIKPCISYGILRGTGDIFKACASNGVDWFYVDHGYFGRSHSLYELDGYFRLCANSTRGTYYSALAKDGKRFDDLGLTVKEWTQGEKIIICPPSEYVAAFYGFNGDEWLDNTIERLRSVTDRTIVVRLKNCERSLADDLADAWCVVGYNSNALVDALVAGVPAISDVNDIIRSWNGLTFEDIEGDLTGHDRRPLFNYLANTQFTLEEFKEGAACHLLSTWAGMPEKK